MSRIQLLQASLNKEDYQGQALAIVSKDVKFINRNINEIVTQIDKIETDIEDRLSEGTPIDKALVTSTYASLVALRDEKKLWEDFYHEFIENPETNHAPETVSDSKSLSNE